MAKLSCLFILVALLYVVSGTRFNRFVNLSDFKIDQTKVSISGISAGGCFATQAHVALSSQIMGLGIISAVPYFCALDNLAVATTECMNYPFLIDMNVLYSAVADFASVGGVDDIKYLSNARVWVEHGTKDSVVAEGATQKLVDFYNHYTSNSTEYIGSKFDLPAEHSFITNNFGNQCGYLGEPYINNCNYDSAGQILSWIYGSLNNAVNPISSNLVQFEQSKYVPLSIPPSDISLSDTGYAYIPSACKNGSSTLCKLHFALHGCNQQYDKVGDAFVKNAGYNRWAEANNIIVVYPQTIAPTKGFPFNPQACWDWWGYTGPEYATKAGPQIGFIQNMITAFNEKK